MGGPAQPLPSPDFHRHDLPSALLAHIGKPVPHHKTLCMNRKKLDFLDGFINLSGHVSDQISR